MGTSHTSPTVQPRRPITRVDPCIHYGEQRFKLVRVMTRGRILNQSVVSVCRKLLTDALCSCYIIKSIIFKLLRKKQTRNVLYIHVKC